MTMDWDVRDTCFVCGFALGRMVQVDRALCRVCQKWHDDLRRAVHAELERRGVLPMAQNDRSPRKV